jgi:hypothetical protein
MSDEPEKAPEPASAESAPQPEDLSAEDLAYVTRNLSDDLLDDVAGGVCGEGV